jgi:hypothetical protein
MKRYELWRLAAAANLKLCTREVIWWKRDIAVNQIALIPSFNPTKPPVCRLVVTAIDGASKIAPDASARSRGLFGPSCSGALSVSFMKSVN